MNLQVYTGRGTVRLDNVRVDQRLRAYLTHVGEVHLAWHPLPACAWEQLVAHVGPETGLVTCQGRKVYRLRGTTVAQLARPEIEAEIAGRLVAAPRSSRGGEVRP